MDMLIVFIQLTLFTIFIFVSGASVAIVYFKLRYESTLRNKSLIRFFGREPYTVKVYDGEKTASVFRFSILVFGTLILLLI
jgi:hypothetical protein